jgi:hypothetical protein
MNIMLRSLPLSGTISLGKFDRRFELAGTPHLERTPANRRADTLATPRGGGTLGPALDWIGRLCSSGGHYADDHAGRAAAL